MGLLLKGASVNAADNKGQTPLHLASLAGQVEVTKLLLFKGAVVDVEDNEGQTPLHVACCRTPGTAGTGVLQLLLLFKGQISMTKLLNAATACRSGAAGADIVTVLLVARAQVSAEVRLKLKALLGADSVKLNFWVPL